MTRLRRFAMAALAAATVTVASLGVVPTASAMPLSCAARWSLSNSYWALGAAFYAVGDDTYAYYWWGKAEAIVIGCY
ncbi:MAG: hypothetical protein ABW318_21645 [Vicinamibacterales bacterium]